MNKDDQRQDTRSTPEQAVPNQEAGQSQQDPTARTGESPLSGQTVPPSGEADREKKVLPAASETWVEGQATSEADYEAQREDRPTP